MRELPLGSVRRIVTHLVNGDVSSIQRRVSFRVAAVTDARRQSLGVRASFCRGRRVARLCQLDVCDNKCVNGGH